MRSVPVLLREAFRAAIRVSMQEILNGVEAHSEVRAERDWKLFMLLPWMLLFRPARAAWFPAKKLEGRVRQFQEGDWITILSDSATQAKVASVRARRRDRSNEATLAARAMSLVQVGELSAARQALEGAALVPGNLATMRALKDPAKRPPFPREELSVEVARVELEEPFQLDVEEFLLCLRKARRGAAPGPSGMTSDHLFTVLENEGDSDLFA